MEPEFRELLFINTVPTENKYLRDQDLRLEQSLPRHRVVSRRWTACLLGWNSFKLMQDAFGVDWRRQIFCLDDENPEHALCSWL
jgi:hypothetical protein